MTSRLLSAEEVARILNISRSQAYNLMHRGVLAMVRIERSVRVREEDLQEFIEEHWIPASLSNENPD